MSKIILEGKGITKKFGRVLALNEVNIELYQGELLGLIGDNGAGKSTLLHILSGYLPLTSGEIYLNSQKVVIPNPRKARELGIGIVHQRSALVWKRSIVENFFATNEIEKKIGFIRVYDSKTMEKEVKDSLRKLGFNLDPTKIISEISGGERQIIQTSRVLYLDPSIILLDEPFTALSKGARDIISDIIGKKIKGKKSVILVSHDLYHVKELSDRIMILKRGEVSGCVDPDKSVEKLIEMM